MKTTVFTATMMAAFAVNAGWNLNLTSGWRVIGSGNYNSRLKADLHVNGSRALPYMPSVPSYTAVDKKKAEAASKAILNGERVEFPNGAFIDPNYAGKDFMPEYTWNWYVPAGAFENSTMTFNYDYVDVTSVSSGSLYNNINQDAEMPGFTVELQRNLGQWGDFGLDLGFGFSYFCRNNIFKSSGEVYRRTDTVEQGSYTSSVAMDADLADYAKNEDGSYGYKNGNYDGPGTLLPLSIGGVSAFTFGYKSISTPTTSSMYLDSKADYDEIELTLTLKPYYDVTEWFRVVGTFGAAVSRGHLDFDMWATSNGKRIYSNSESFHQWDCYGIGGLGGMFHYSYMCLGFDFLARFLDRDIEINSPDVSGHLERSNWMFRVYAGVEF